MFSLENKKSKHNIRWLNGSAMDNIYIMTAVNIKYWFNQSIAM